MIETPVSWKSTEYLRCNNYTKGLENCQQTKLKKLQFSGLNNFIHFNLVKLTLIFSLIFDKRQKHTTPLLSNTYKREKSAQKQRKIRPFYADFSFEYLCKICINTCIKAPLYAKPRIYAFKRQKMHAKSNSARAFPAAFDAQNAAPQQSLPPGGRWICRRQRRKECKKLVCVKNYSSVTASPRHLP